MSAVTPATPPLTIFGDLDAGLWGIVVGGEQPRAALAGLSEADVVPRPVHLELEDAGACTITGAGLALRIEPEQAGSANAEGGRRLAPCRVSGSAQIAGAERQFDVRGVHADALAVDGLDSVRLLGTWFAAGQELGLLSSRPRGARNQDRDAIDVIARGEEHPLVLDPRLSTTYDGHEAPLRIAIELWLSDSADEDAEHWPRRVAGAVTGSRVDGPALSAHALECVSRGEAGAGVYVLVRG